MLQYTDGTIFVGEVNVKNIFTIKAILRLFEVIFGLRMNFHKSSFGTIGVELGEIFTERSLPEHPSREERRSLC